MSKRDKRRKPEHRSALAGVLLAGGGIVLLGIAGAAAAWAAGVGFARKAVMPESAVDEPVTVERVQDVGVGQMAWLRGEGAALPGRYSLIFDQGNGHARLGSIMAENGDRVAREIVAIDRGTLAAGATGRITGWWYTDPAELGFRTEHISYPTELGDAEAWVIHPRRAKKNRWAIHVHGRGALPQETLRGVSPLARAGITNLVISYRNDPGAPLGENGRYGLGIAETRDVDAAIAEALRRGAERITLFGWSMGGTASLISATKGPHVGVIDGVILDSPAVDWESLLRHHARLSRAPQTVATLGIELLQRGVVRGGEAEGLDVAALTPEAFGRGLTMPVLIHASTRDTYVPCAGSERLAAARPELVQLRLQSVGEHVRLWNVDPEPWERVTEQFARALPRPPWRG